MTSTTHSSSELLNLADLKVTYPGARSRLPVTVVDDVSLKLRKGSTTVIVGESGSGKTTMLRSLLALNAPTATVQFGALEFAASDDHLAPIQPAGLRGSSIGLIPQDPSRSLDPLRRISTHFEELHRHFHGIRSRRRSQQLAIEALHDVGVPDGRERLRQYPHQLSGGLLQRILIALALVPEPKLLLADEPTSNLDATVQAKVLKLLRDIQETRGLTVLLVTHDITLAAENSDFVVVMKDGTVCEHGPSSQVLRQPEHPYTKELVHASIVKTVPPSNALSESSRSDDILSVRDLSKSYRGSGKRTETKHVLSGLNFELKRHQSLAIVGESGAGKTTLLRIIANLDQADRGMIAIGGVPASARSNKRTLSRKIQLLHQNPARSLNPRLRVSEIVAEPLEAHHIGTRPARNDQVNLLLEQVGLKAELAGRRPSSLSGGQLQRVALARALALEPDVLVLDEPVSALDAIAQSKVIELLAELQSRLGLSYLLVSHDLSMVSALAHEVLVLHHGHIIERGPTGKLINSPEHSHTQALVAALPRLPDEAPSPVPSEGASP